MLRWVGDSEDDLDVGVKRGKAQVEEVRPHVEEKFVVGGHQAVFAKQSLASAVVVGGSRADFVPLAACGVVAELGEPDGNIGCGAAKICVENVDRKSTRLNSSHLGISYAVFCLKK